MANRWKYLEAGLERIWANPQNPVDAKAYIGLYTAAYNYCSRPVEDRNRAGTSCSSHAILASNVVV